MIRSKGVIRVALLLLLIAFGLMNFGFISKSAEALPSGTILIGQAKITSSNGQFISLFNNTNNEIDMSTVQLAYYNYYDLSSTKLTSSRYIPLSGKLAAHSYYMVNDGTLVICYKMTVNSVSLGFSTTAGTVQVTQNGPANVLDSLAWSKTAVSGNSSVQTLPASTSGFFQRAWLEGVSKTPNDPWISVTPSAADSCDLQTQIAASSTPAAPTATATPQTVKTVAPETTPVINPKLGLVAPELTEVFPNPATPQSDDSDEFIELYNPNSSEFSLAGYRLEAGTTYSRGFTFNTGSLAPKSYTAFKITDTNLQLSNSEGQVRLLDIDKNTISETPAYEDAPDGESWSLIGDSWQWSDVPTPNNVNLPSKTAVKPTSTTNASAKQTSKKSTSGKVAGAITTTPSTTVTELKDAAPLHPLVLAGVAAAAVGYAIYEYRKDFANQIFKFRRYFRNRREIRARV